MARSIAFYRNVLGMEVTADFGANVTLSGCVALQTMDTWKTLVRTENVTLGTRSGELYFEEDDMDGFLQKLERMDVRYAHPVETQPWGQRAVRIYDPDGHIIEIGENMVAVVKRFSQTGMTPEEIAARMDIAEAYVQMYLTQA